MWILTGLNLTAMDTGGQIKPSEKVGSAPDLSNIFPQCARPHLVMSSRLSMLIVHNNKGVSGSKLA